MPSEHSTRLNSAPAASAVTVLPASTPLRFTATGTRRVVVVPSPNCPFSLLPHAARVPSEHKARLCRPPLATATTVLPANTPRWWVGSGTVLSSELSIPNWP